MPSKEKENFWTSQVVIFWKGKFAFSKGTPKGQVRGLYQRYKPPDIIKFAPKANHDPKTDPKVFPWKVEGKIHSFWF